MKNAEVTKKKNYKLMWQAYDQCYLNNRMNECLKFFFLSSDMLFCKANTIKFVISVVSLK